MVRSDGLKMLHHSACGMQNGGGREIAPAQNVLNNELKMVIDYLCAFIIVLQCESS